MTCSAAASVDVERVMHKRAAAIRLHNREIIMQNGSGRPVAGHGRVRSG